MGPRTKHKRHTVDLLAVQAQIDNIALQISDARTAASLKGTIQNARKIKNCAQRLTKDVEKLIKAMESPMGLPSKPAKKNKSGAQSFNFQQDSLLNCCYSGAVKFGSAQMWESIVPTIHEAMSDWDAHKELGFFKVKIEENVMRNIDPAKISNSIIDALDKCQSKILRFSGMPKRHRLHGLVCDVLIEDDPSSLFEIPHLDAKGYGLDCRELFCSTVRDASRSNRKPYLVNPADSSSRWRESVGLPQEPYLDCGERLKMTSSRIPGVHTAYEYYSTGRGSGSAMHVEDGYLGSMNLVLAGAPKVWLLVQPRFREKLEAKVKEELMEDTGSYVCSQFVRHLDKLLSPELLDSWEIPYHTVPCKAGEMIVTLSETYHQVINAGTNYAVAVNFAVEPDWTGVPAGYGFCKKGCSPGVEPITAEQLRVQESDAHGPDCQADEDEVYSDDEPKEPYSNAYPTSDHAPGNTTSVVDKDIEAFIDATIRSATTEFPTPSPEWPQAPPTPGDPTSDTLKSRSNTPTVREINHDGSKIDEDRALCSDNEEIRETSENKPGAAFSEVDARNSVTSNGDSGAAEPVINAHNAGEDSITVLGISKMPRDATSADKEDWLLPPSTKSETPVQLIEDSEDEFLNIVQLPLKSATKASQLCESVEAKINRLIEEALPFLQAIDLSQRTLECFQPGQRLNDEAISKTLETILPAKAAPLIASFAITNFPSFGLSKSFTELETASAIRPQLVHEIDSTHLFIAYNVLAHSLQLSADGSGNHWILIVVDFLNTNIHLFGAEKGLETPARIIARNVGQLVNAFRAAEGYDEVKWTEPRIQPLYPVDWFPDDYNCGIAVISRAEAFMYPEKALVVSAGTTSAELSKRLDELRATYLESIVRRCNRVRDDELVSAQLGISTPIRNIKKRPYPFAQSEERSIAIAKSAFKRRPDSLLPTLEKIPRSETEEWGDCIFRAAQSSGLNGRGLVEALGNSPNNDLGKVLRVLQCACEVANRDRLFQLREMLRFGQKPLLEQPPTDLDVAKLADLHSSISRFAGISYLAQYQSYMSQALYYQWFESAVQERSKLMKIARAERDKVAQRIRRRHRSGIEPRQAPTNDLLSRNRDISKGSSARTKLKDELVNHLVHMNKDRETVSRELENNIRKGKILNLLLSPPDNRCSRTDIRFLSLFPLYKSAHDHRDSRPSLDLMAHGPPKAIKSLSEPVSDQELLNFNEALLGFFGKSLFTVRPELARIDANLLPGARGSRPEIDSVRTNAHKVPDEITIYLKDAHDGELRDTKPFDVTRFFEPVGRIVTTPRRLEFS